MIVYHSTNLGWLMKKLLITTALVAQAATAAYAQAADDAVIARYSKSCAVCHTSGVANAPKTGNADDWAPRLAKGMDVLVKSAENGLNAMPPKALCMDCSADDYKALIEYMATPK